MVLYRDFELDLPYFTTVEEQGNHLASCIAALAQCPLKLYILLPSALSNGADAAIDMKIGTTRYSDDVSQYVELYICERYAPRLVKYN